MLPPFLNLVRGDETLRVDSNGEDDWYENIHKKWSRGASLYVESGAKAKVSPDGDPKRDISKKVPPLASYDAKGVAYVYLNTI
jgi:hypothetical protein